MFDKFIKSRKTSFSTPMGRAVSTASVIGLHMVVAVFIGFGAGLFLDRFFNTAPWLTIVFLLVGIIAGFKNLVSQGRRLMAIQEQMDKERQAEELKANIKPSIKADIKPLNSSLQLGAPNGNVNSLPDFKVKSKESTHDN